jgi:K(+)-stimulated pyrophosphate-energized sodium pump
MEGTGKPNMQNVDISTKAALREMMLPGILTIGFPIVVVPWETGLWGQQSISGRNAWRIYGWGYCLGSTLGCFQNNGGAWDNANLF